MPLRVAHREDNYSASRPISKERRFLSFEIKNSRPDCCFGMVLRKIMNSHSNNINHRVSCNDTNTITASLHVLQHVLHRANIKISQTKDFRAPQHQEEETHSSIQPLFQTSFRIGTPTADKGDELEHFDASSIAFHRNRCTQRHRVTSFQLSRRSRSAPRNSAHPPLLTKSETTLCSFLSSMLIFLSSTDEAFYCESGLENELIIF